MRNPTSPLGIWRDERRDDPLRIGTARGLGCLTAACSLIVGISGCETLFGSSAQTNEASVPVAIATVEATPSPTPSVSADDDTIAIAQKASLAAEKARVASAKAASASQEAAKASAEASEAATEAALAIKRAGGPAKTKHPRKAAKRSSSSKSAAISAPSAVPSPTIEQALATTTTTTRADMTSSGASAPNLVSAGDAAQDQSTQIETARLIDQTSSSLKKISRDKLDSQDIERYEVATKLLKNAHDSFAAQDFIAARSLVIKAAVLIRPLTAASTER